MELTQVEKMMVAAKKQMVLHTSHNGEYKGTRRNLPVLDDACDLTDEEYDAIAEETHANLVGCLIEANVEIGFLRSLLKRAYEQLLLLGFDSGFTNEEIGKLTNDIKMYLEEIK